MKFEGIRSEGGLIGYDLLAKIAAGEAEGQKPTDFWLEKGTRLNDEISRVWSDAQHYWAIFHSRREKLPQSDPYGTTLTRERWIMPLLSDKELLYFDLARQASGVMKESVNYPISHRATHDKDAPPVHIVGCEISLDSKAPGQRTSPHSMIQTFLNVSEEDLWAVVTNGLKVRLVRDSTQTARPTYLEFDLESILQGNRFDEFALFYRLCHRTRFPILGEPPEQCILENYHQESVEQGGRIRDGLRDGVEEALKLLGTSLLRHPENNDLRDKVASGKLSPADFHRQLLHLIYRLLFLMVAEERRLIVSTVENGETLQRLYDNHYSVNKLRDRAERIVEVSPYSDLWLGLQQTFKLFEYGQDTNAFGIPPLNGDLFDWRAMEDLRETHVYNHQLLLAMRHISLFTENKVRQRVNYSGLDVEELGSVYESLLDYQPVVEQEPKGPEFDLRTGTERKTTGSYYTRPELVQELIKSALVPVIEDRLKEAEKKIPKEDAEAVRQAKIDALLNITVCDPACGSGHFLLAAARRIGRELAQVRTGEEEPTPEQFHLAVRDTITHCIYGVDLNPLAVDLCKLALWLEGHWAGKPLSFLDHRIRCGNSLVGVLDPSVLDEGIPDDAYKPVTGDDKKVAAALKRQNKQEQREEQGLLSFDKPTEAVKGDYAARFSELSQLTDESPAEVRKKAELYKKTRSGEQWWHDWTAANLWTAAFFTPLIRDNQQLIPTTQPLHDYLFHNQDKPQMTGKSNALATQHRFFHWHLEFPEVFAGGGFDVVLGNPPWDMLQLDAREFFSQRAPQISNAPTTAARNKLITKLTEDNPKLSAEYEAAKQIVDSYQSFVHSSGRFPLTSFGRINLMALFCELGRMLVRPKGRAGLLVPIGIATDSFNQFFFSDLVKHHALCRLLGFENEAFIFPAVHHSFKFCAITVAGEQGGIDKAEFAFFCRHFPDVSAPARQFKLSSKDFLLLNPNTRTCPVFRTRADAEFTKKIYRRVPVLMNEQAEQDPWGFRSLLMFMMNTDSNLFEMKSGNGLLPLYEGKMIYQFDHRYGTYEGATQAQLNVGNLPQPNTDYKKNPEFRVVPRYWVPEEPVAERLEKRSRDRTELLWRWEHDWLIGFRDITSSVVERSAIFSVLPRVGVGNKIPLVFLRKAPGPQFVACFLANVNSVVFDYVVRQKLAGTSLNFFILKQLPVMPPEDYSPTDVEHIWPRVLELVYTASDVGPFATYLGYKGEPFRWDEERRAQIRAELDGYYAHLYGLTRDELQYILNPKDVFGEDFPSETFRVLKEKEEKKFGEYRTRRLVLEAYDELAKTDRFKNDKRECTIAHMKKELNL